MWKYKKKNIKSINDVPKDVIGMIYLITDENGKMYIGRKSFYSVRNTQVSKAVYDKAKANGEIVSKNKNKKFSKKGKPVWRYKREQIKETNWLNYTGSCKPLNAAIKKGLKIKKEILRFCTNSKQMTYYEWKYQFCNDVIENNSDYWNENVCGKFFPDDLK